MAVCLTIMWQGSALNIRSARCLIVLGSILQSFILQAFVKSLQWTLVLGLRTVLILKSLMPWPAQTSMLQCNTLNGETRGRTAIAVVPVKVHSRKSNRTVVTFAFLDTGSSATFCTESLMKKLEERGPKVKISTVYVYLGKEK